jgi:hypothetical protein
MDKKNHYIAVWKQDITVELRELSEAHFRLSLVLNFRMHHSSPSSSNRLTLHLQFYLLSIAEMSW